jgi:hypothetical protein
MKLTLPAFEQFQQDFYSDPTRDIQDETLAFYEAGRKVFGPGFDTFIDTQAVSKEPRQLSPLAKLGVCSHSYAAATAKPPKSICHFLGLNIGAPHLIIAETHSGKTILSNYIACCVATGSPIFGNPLSRDYQDGNRVLSLQYEMSKAQESLTIDRLVKGHGFNPDLVGSNILQCTNPPSLPALLATNPCEIFRNITLCIIDSLSAACPGIDENSNGDGISQYLIALKTISEQTGCVFVILHHMGKGGEGSNRAHSARGGSSIAASADTIINLTRELDAKEHWDQGRIIYTISHSKKRLGAYMRPQHYCLVDSGATLGEEWGYVSEALEVCAIAANSLPTPEDKMRAEIETVLKKHTQGLTMTELKEAVGGNNDRKVRVIHSMFGDIKRGEKLTLQSIIKNDIAAELTREAN